ncbi:MAG: hypothetical protein OIF34_06520, partial [Porticoccaceae bacterium]|nr:hypothetical protein [Porticoccaceae bacterium]
ETATFSGGRFSFGHCMILKTRITNSPASQHAFYFYHPVCGLLHRNGSGAGYTLFGFPEEH